MSDFINSGWAWYVAGLTVASLAFCVFILVVASKRKLSLPNINGGDLYGTHSFLGISIFPCSGGRDYAFNTSGCNDTGGSTYYFSIGCNGDGDTCQLGFIPPPYGGGNQEPWPSKHHRRHCHCQHQHRHSHHQHQHCHHYHCHCYHVSF